MDLRNEFRVELPVDEAFAVLTDLERIAPCMPGAVLESVEGDDFTGTVKVKVGPLTAQYRGTARFVERDEVNHRVVIRAEGRETRGQGNAAATVTASLTRDGTGSKVEVLTDLTISGKVAQFGRGVLADVSGQLLGQFVAQLEQDIATSGASTSPAGGSTSRRSAAAPKADAVNLLGAVGVPVLKRVAPLVAVVVVVVLLARRSRRGRRIT